MVSEKKKTSTVCLKIGDDYLPQSLDDLKKLIRDNQLEENDELFIHGKPLKAKQFKQLKPFFLDRNNSVSNGKVVPPVSNNTEEIRQHGRSKKLIVYVTGSISLIALVCVAIFWNPFTAKSDKNATGENEQVTKSPEVKANVKWHELTHIENFTSAKAALQNVKKSLSSDGFYREIVDDMSIYEDTSGILVSNSFDEPKVCRIVLKIANKRGYGLEEEFVETIKPNSEYEITKSVRFQISRNEEPPNKVEVTISEKRDTIVSSKTIRYEQD